MKADIEKCNHVIMLFNSILWDFSDEEVKIVLEGISNKNGIERKALNKRNVKLR